MTDISPSSTLWGLKESTNLPDDKISWKRRRSPSGARGQRDSRLTGPLDVRRELVCVFGGNPKRFGGFRLKGSEGGNNNNNNKKKKKNKKKP